MDDGNDMKDGKKKKRKKFVQLQYYDLMGESELGWMGWILGRGEEERNVGVRLVWIR